ncbi:armadillo-type protein [Entophlyctis helioformis]|nr:armadillo-type protein [Entophlyctis helioformis]
MDRFVAKCLEGLEQLVGSGGLLGSGRQHAVAVGASGALPLPDVLYPAASAAGHVAGGDGRDVARVDPQTDSVRLAVATERASRLLRGLVVAATSPQVQSEAAVVSLALLLRSCTSFGVTFMMLDAIRQVTAIKHVFQKMSEQAMVACLSSFAILVNDEHARIRKVALELVGSMSLVPKIRPQALRIVSAFLNDPAANVQVAALLILLPQLWSEKNLHNLIIWPSLRLTLLGMLESKDDAVRSATVDILWCAAQRMPTERVESSPGDKSQRVPMCDDVFMRLCDIVNDPSLFLRAKALLLLGTLRKVSPSLHSQTLSKEIGGVSKLRRSQKDTVMSQSQRMDAGDFDISNSDDVSLKSTSMCGAFIHGLEDEFAIVRSNAIDAICELACGSIQFADTSVPFLVDMFNDEHRDIRLNAITSVAKISARWAFQLKDDLVDTVILALFDGDADIREATHKLVGMTKFDSDIALKRLVDVLHKARDTFSDSELSILATFAGLGRSHPDLVGGLQPMDMTTTQSHGRMDIL